MNKPVDKWYPRYGYHHCALAKGGTGLWSRPLPNTPVSAPRLNRWTGHKRASGDQLWARNRGDSSLHCSSTWKVHGNSTWLWPWKSTWCHVENHTTLHAMHVGVPGRVSGVDAASCKSVGNTGGSGDFFTNCHLFVVCMRLSAIYRPSPMYHPESWRI